MARKEPTVEEKNGMCALNYGGSEIHFAASDIPKVIELLETWDSERQIREDESSRSEERDRRDSA